MSHTVHGKREYSMTDMPELVDIIIKSLTQFNRLYLLPKIDDGNQPIKYYSMIKLLREAFAHNKKEVGPNILRSSYITNELNKRKSEKDFMNLAIKLRTSLDQMRTMYYKVDVNNEDNIEQIELDNKQKKDKHAIIKKQQNAAYYLTHKDKFLKRKPDGIIKKKLADKLRYDRLKAEKLNATK